MKILNWVFTPLASRLQYFGYLSLAFVIFTTTYTLTSSFFEKKKRQTRHRDARICLFVALTHRPNVSKQTDSFFLTSDCVRSKQFNYYINIEQ